jgi:hypothetical protein
MLTFVMDGPFVLERIDTSSLALMMPSGAVHPIISAAAARQPAPLQHQYPDVVGITTRSRMQIDCGSL